MKKPTCYQVFRYLCSVFKLIKFCNRHRGNIQRADKMLNKYSDLISKFLPRVNRTCYPSRDNSKQSSNSGVHGTPVMRRLTHSKMKVLTSYCVFTVGQFTGPQM